jgi:hypothetical protein
VQIRIGLLYNEEHGDLYGQLAVARSSVNIVSDHSLDDRSLIHGRGNEFFL